MNFNWANRLQKAFSRFRRITRYKETRWIPSRDELPQNLGTDIFVVEKCGKPVWVIMKCPCGCGDRIEVNLMRSKRPCWRLKRKGNAISLFPSLWVSRDKCGSHFFLIRNTVRWIPGVVYVS